MAVKERNNVWIELWSHKHGLIYSHMLRLLTSLQIDQIFHQLEGSCSREVEQLFKRAREMGFEH